MSSFCTNQTKPHALVEVKINLYRVVVKVKINLCIILTKFKNGIYKAVIPAFLHVG